MTPTHAFELQFVVRWSDMDANRHMKNTAFSEYAVDTRFQMLMSRGFDQARFEELRSFTSLPLPSGGRIGLYQPQHPSPLDGS